MRKRRVAVVSIHSLFGRGLAQLLKSDARLAVTCLTAGAPETADSLRSLKPDAIVMEEGVETRLIDDAMRGLPPVLLIGVRPDDNSIDVRQEWHVTAATPTDLLDAVHTTLTVRRRGAASQV